MLKPNSRRKSKKNRRRVAVNAPPRSVISLRVDNTIKKSLEQYAHKSRRSLSEVLREALEFWSARHAVPFAADEVRGRPRTVSSGLTS